MTTGGFPSGPDTEMLFLIILFFWLKAQNEQNSQLHDHMSPTGVIVSGAVRMIIQHG